MKARNLLIILPAVLFGFYLAGPSPDFIPGGDKLPPVPEDPSSLVELIKQHENIQGIKPDNEARIVWFDSARRKTPISIIYLHGFRASQKEGDPIHKRIAKAFGCNLYMNRMPEHGIETADALLNFTADELWLNVREALAIGKAIGDKVIILSTSTGGTAAIYLASQYPDDVYALINMSPNIEINNATAFLLNNHWGIQLAKLSQGSYMEFEETKVTSQYWTPKLRVEALGQLEEFVEQTMTKETFSKVKVPSLTLYYYKSETEQDPVLRVSAMINMNEQLATPGPLKAAIAVPTAGAHCMGSDLTSKDVDGVYNQIETFFINTLKLSKAEGN